MRKRGHTNQVVEILTVRDNMTVKEAEELLEYVKDLINTEMYLGNYEAIEEIIANYLGLEMDYIFDILY